MAKGATTTATKGANVKEVAAAIGKALDTGELPPIVKAVMALLGRDARELIYEIFNRSRALQPWGGDEREFWAVHARQAVGRVVLGSMTREDFVDLTCGVVCHFLQHPEALGE